MRAAVASVLLIVVPWSFLAFRGMGTYPQLLQVLSRVELPNGIFVQALAARAGCGATTCAVIGFLLSIVLLAMAAAWRDDHLVYVFALIAGLASSPIVWMFYLALVAVAIGARQRTYSPVWLLVPALWFPSLFRFPPTLLMIVESLLIVGVLLFWSLRPELQPRFTIRGRPSLSSAQRSGAAARPT